jgi:hypothetical protein
MNAPLLNTLKTLKFGIEIETTGLAREPLARAIADALGGSASLESAGWTARDLQGRPWRIVRDASINGGDSSGEIVSPPLAYADLELLQQVVRGVRKAGARTDASTGIHIHVDGGLFNAQALTFLVKSMHKQERLLEHALRIEPGRLARFCKPIDEAFLARLERAKPRTLEGVSQAWYGRAGVCPSRYDGSRYHGLNLNSFFFRTTIEFRYFNGTLHAGEVKAYVQLVLGLAAKALTAKSASSKRRDFNPATAKYDFRVLLLSLGMVGDEFKTARLHLTKHLAGSAAWKGERRDRRANGNAPAPSAAPATSDATPPSQRAA